MAMGRGLRVCAQAAVSIVITAGQALGMGVDLQPSSLLTTQTNIQLLVATDNYGETGRGVTWNGRAVTVELTGSMSLIFDNYSGVSLGKLAAGQYSYVVTLNGYNVSDTLGGPAGFHVYRSTGRGDFNGDGKVDVHDIGPLVLAMSDVSAWEAANPDLALTLADLTGDGMIDVQDINPFVQKLAGQPTSSGWDPSPAGVQMINAFLMAIQGEDWRGRYPTVPAEAMDFTHDGRVNVQDINGFVKMLADTNGGQVIPEPGQGVVAALGATGVMARRRR